MKQTREEKRMKIEPLTKKMVNVLKATLTPVQIMVSGLNEVDLSKGRGVLDETGRKHCMWTNDGRRVEVVISTDGGILISQSNDPDPEMP